MCVYIYVSIYIYVYIYIYLSLSLSPSLDLGAEDFRDSSLRRLNVFRAHLEADMIGNSKKGCSAG